MINIAFEDRFEGSGIPDQQSLARWVGWAEAHCKNCELGITVVGTDESRALNARWRGIDRATNVQSFPLEMPPGDAPTLLGDIVICAPLVESEAARDGISPEAHWAHLVVHGVLHLLGFDHEQDEDAIVMEDKERAVLAGLGFPDPYAATIEK